MSPTNDTPVTGPVPVIAVHGTQLVREPLTLNCNYALDQPLDDSVGSSLQWRVNGTRLVTSQNDRITVNESNVTFSPLIASDSGRYTCAVGIYGNTPYILFDTFEQTAEVNITAHSELVKKN